MNRHLINIILGILMACSGSATADKAKVEALAFTLPGMDGSEALQNQSTSLVFDALESRISYNFNQPAVVFDLEEFKNCIAQIGGSIIGRPLVTGEWDSEIEARFLNPIICRILEPDGTITERLSNPDESPGLSLVVTPRLIPGNSTCFTLDYQLTLALLTDSLLGDPPPPAEQCPELLRHEFSDRIETESGRWQIIGLLIFEDPVAQTMYEVWVMTRLRVE